jgi:ribosomal protein S18 acetylase RimI-like enzyme
MGEADFGRILEFRTIVSWSVDARAFSLLGGMNEARWMVAEAGDTLGALVGMVGAVPLGSIGILCHLAVRHDYRKNGLGARLTFWAVSYLRSQGARTVRLDSTVKAENLYRSLGFEPVSQRAVYRLEGTERRMRVGDDR